MHFPHLAAERLSRGRDDAAPPLAVTAARAGGMRVLAVDARAAALGLWPGMTLADARARIPELATAPADPAADAAFLLRLVALCERYTPVIALDAPNGLLLDITGCAHLWGGEGALHAAIRRRFARMTLRSAIAGTADAARALARFGGDDLRDLPVAALEPSPRAARALAQAGLRRLGDLAARPAAALAARFGMALVQRLRRVLGEEDAPITPLRPPPDFTAARVFAEPLTRTEALATLLAGMLEELCAAMTAAGMGGRVFALALFRTDGTARELVVESGRPLRDAAAILLLWRERLDGLEEPLDPGFGYDALRLSVARTEPLAATQTGLAGDAAAGDVAALIDVLATRLGRGRVLRFAPCATHRPERAARRIPALEPPAPWQPMDAPRPLQLFDPPRIVTAMAFMPDGPPLRFRWKGRVHDVTLAEGPERIAPEWWREDAVAARDYYRVEDAQGRRFWLFREDGDDAPRWFLHGVFA